MMYPILLIALTLSLAASSRAGAERATIQSFNLVHQTREASMILTGRLMNLETDRPRIKVEKVLKGILNDEVIIVQWDRIRTFEMNPVRVAAGETLLLFLNATGPPYTPHDPNRSIFKLEPSWGDAYLEAIRSILTFDATMTKTARTTALVEMLNSSNPFRQGAAAEIIAQTTPALGNFRTPPLIPSLQQLVQSTEHFVASLSIRALGRIGTRSVVPILISLFGSPHAPIAEQAYYALKTIIQTDLTFDPKAPHKERTQAMQAWQAWWKEKR
ncbi:MAG: hypothetical protein ETSY2_30725 [Candidatus Entotheonella gemina]|uniref:HEAT repeat domain-containing protein n=1 Tax=Candidatus Entotheonella gemina TaxID=1429439 RepID=W4M182_9BACT|nr:MAG: hypothetical protein ETSY2_30725 [Candidatus Entotheonella gemina]